MNLSLSEELHLFSQELQRFLSPIVLQEIAKQVVFVQRSSRASLKVCFPCFAGTTPLCNCYFFNKIV